MKTTNASRRAQLTKHIAAGGFLDAAKIHLFKTDLTITPATLLAAFVAAEADFNTYAAVAAGAWGLVGTNPSDQAEVTAAEIEFQPTDNLNPNDIWGWFLTNAGSTELLGYEKYATPVHLGEVWETLRIVPRWALPED